MTLRQLKWITVLAPLALLLGLDLLRTAVEPELFHAWPGYVLTAGIVLFSALLFSEVVFGFIGRMQSRLAQQNRELLALHEAGLGIAGELGLETVLQKVVDQARDLIAARYGALSVPAPGGGIEAFLTSGISDEERARIGPPPVGHGLLAVVLKEGQRLRLADLTKDPRSHGFPPHHPPMRSLLAVPIISRGQVLGNLYLAEKVGAPEFSQDDEDTLVRFATQAALAIENAHLHRQVRDVAIVEERERIAREMHDGLAQVLGYVNTKAQAIQELIRGGQAERAVTQVGQLGDAARAAYADVREGILGLRTSLGPGRTFLEAVREYLAQWEEQSEVRTTLEVEPAGSELRSLTPSAEVQLLRLIQEALSNVRKHANATRARVRFVESAAGVELTVIDNGQGFEPTRPSGNGTPRFGLSTMRERAEAVGGRLEITSRPGEGTCVTVYLPAATASSTGRDFEGDTRRAGAYR